MNLLIVILYRIVYEFVALEEENESIRVFYSEIVTSILHKRRILI